MARRKTTIKILSLILLALATQAQAQEQTLQVEVTVVIIGEPPFPYFHTGEQVTTEETQDNVTTITASMCPSRYDLAGEDERRRMRGITLGHYPVSAIIALGQPADEMQRAWADKIVNVKITAPPMQ